MRLATIAALLATTSLIGCGNPVPPEKASYVGDWRAKDMRLSISAGGRVEYRRVEGRVSTKISAPLQRFEGPHFDVGLGPFSTRFDVSAPPRDDGEGRVTMTVDGVELVRH